MQLRLFVTACVLVALGLVATAGAGDRRDNTVLEARAVLPADTFAPGPPSGAFTVRVYTAWIGERSSSPCSQNMSMSSASYSRRVST